jgi:hypothetical protein
MPFSPCAAKIGRCELAADALSAGTRKAPFWSPNFFV